MVKRFFYLFFGIIGLAAIIQEYLVATNIPNFFSFFTIQSNIFLILMFFFFGITNQKTYPRIVEFLLGGAIVVMTITGIGYWVFLRNISIGVPWSLNTLHLVMPLAALLSWFLYRHTTRLPWKYAIFWLGFPLAYLIYTFTRAAVINWYPYDFLNPQIQGYPGVLKNIALLMTPGFITGLILVWIGNRCLDKKKNS